ncbi:MAG: tetratricopeptide (TPR) repeat protein [Verrucomicrobiales bacterium]|jgi:tetratricopeptide (TPR) repeat protein
MGLILSYLLLVNVSGQDRNERAAPLGKPTDAIRCLLDLRMYEKALGMCRHTLESTPDDPEVHQLAGVAALAMEDLSTAGLHLEAAMREDPEDADTHYHMSRYWHERGFPRRAEESAERALSFNAYDASYWKQLGWISYREGHFRKARERAERACELAPDDPSAANILALAEAECEDGTKWDPDDQVKALVELLVMDPENAALHHNLGLVYCQELGDYEQAARHFATAVDLDPKEKLSRDFLAKSIQRQDRFLRCLQWPWLIGPSLKRVGRWGGKRPGRWLLLGPLALVLFLPAIILLGLWAVWLWPVAKGYEFLTDAEARRKMQIMGEPGFLGVHRWSFAVRFGLFLVGLVAFWSGLILFWHVQAVKMTFGLILGLVLAEWSGLSVRDAWKELCQGWRN